MIRDLIQLISCYLEHSEFRMLSEEFGLNELIYAKLVKPEYISNDLAERILLESKEYDKFVNKIIDDHYGLPEWVDEKKFRDSIKIEIIDYVINSLNDEEYSEVSGETIPKNLPVVDVFPILYPIRVFNYGDHVYNTEYNLDYIIPDGIIRQVIFNEKRMCKILENKKKYIENCEWEKYNQNEPCNL